MHQAQCFAIGMLCCELRVTLKRLSWKLSDLPQDIRHSVHSLMGFAGWFFFPVWCIVGVKGNAHLFADIKVFQFPLYYIGGFIWVMRSLTDIISNIVLLKVEENFLSIAFCLGFALLFNSCYLGRLASPGDMKIHIRPSKRQVIQFTYHHLFSLKCV